MTNGEQNSESDPQPDAAKQPNLSKEHVHQLVSNRLSNFRHRNWEDDVSRNSIDTEPFENLPPITEMKSSWLRREAAGIVDVDLPEYVGRDLAAIPCAEDREGYSGRNNARYWLVGLRDYLDVVGVASQQGVTINRILDFGCASGRVIRHFAAQSDIEEIWGSDLNARHIRWLCENMSANVRPIANHSFPHLPVVDHYFDAITAFSVFTHIDTFETAWLAELRRILSKTGFAYITVHNEDTWKSLRDEVDNENNRLIQSLISMDESLKQKLFEDMPEGRQVFRFTHMGPYRAQVFHSNSYIKNVWGRFFKIVDILPCHHNRQSVVIMK